MLHNFAHFLYYDSTLAAFPIILDEGSLSMSLPNLRMFVDQNVCPYGVPRPSLPFFSRLNTRPQFPPRPSPPATMQAFR